MIGTFRLILRGGGIAEMSASILSVPFRPFRPGRVGRCPIKKKAPV